MNKFKDGDRVRVVNIEELDIVGDMADSIGKEGIYKLGSDNIIKVTFDDGSYWYYLEKNIELVVESFTPLNNTKDLFQALIDGYTIKSTEFNERLQLIEGKLVGSVLLLQEPINKLRIDVPKVPWEKNIPYQGVLCWVDQLEQGDIKHRVCSIIIEYLVTHSCPYTSIAGLGWRRAIPMTEEEVLKYILR
jgi:hypothetical protein